MTEVTADRFLERDLSRLIHPLHDPALVEHAHVWVRGESATLTDTKGRQLIDGASGLWNVVAGHGRQELVEAAAEQMRQLAFCSSFAGNSNCRSIELAERLAELTWPSINQFFFTSGGAEATETSIKTARCFWKLQGQPEKTKTISLEWGYHGVSLAAMSATGIKTYWPLFEPRVPGFIHIPSHYPYRYESDGSHSPGVAAANELERAILREGPETVAMFLVEPVQGAGGVIVPPDDYFPRIREICDQYDVLLVADEIITGFSRTGLMFGLEHWNIEPDLVQFAKAITSGYFPLGGVGFSDQIAEVLKTNDTPFMHAYTYNGHPVGCAIALRNLEIIDQENFCTQAAAKGRHLLHGLQQALGDHPHVGDIRGKGLMCAVEFVQDRATKAEFPKQDRVGPRIHVETQKRGLISRLRGDVFCLAPPVVTSNDELNTIVEVLAESVAVVLGRGTTAG